MGVLVWLVTGCSSGFGEEFVRQILHRGDKVIATARRPESLGRLQSLGAVTLQLDMRASEKEMLEKIGLATEIYGRIDVLVNNAAYIATGAWEDLNYDQFLSQFNTNVFGVIMLTKAILPHFRQQRSGSMVFLGSRSGWYGDPFCGAYAGTKFALEGLVESLRWETQPFGIKTLLIEPGRFRTSFLSDANAQMTKSDIPDYKESSIAFRQNISREDMTQPGDVEKAVRIILDLVKGQGVAVGKEVPFRLPLGTDCYETIRDKCRETLELLDEWRDVITSTDFS